MKVSFFQAFSPSPILSFFLYFSFPSLSLPLSLTHLLASRSLKIEWIFKKPYIRNMLQETAKLRDIPHQSSLFIQILIQKYIIILKKQICRCIKTIHGYIKNFKMFQRYNVKFYLTFSCRSYSNFHFYLSLPGISERGTIPFLVMRR